MAYKIALNNFVTRISLKDYIDELTFLLKWRLKLTKQGARITFIDDLQQKFKLECRLDVFSLKQWAEKLVTILKTAIENNYNDPLMPQNNRPRLANNGLPNHN